MPWTEGDVQNLFMAYWDGKRLTCPKCTAILTVEHTELVDAYVLKIACPRRCGMMTKSAGDDPLKSKFRDWNKPECETAMVHMLQHGGASCPVDGADLTCTQQPNADGRNTVTLHCPRCGRGHAETFLPR
jgi:hypothetical protein